VLVVLVEHREQFVVLMVTFLKSFLFNLLVVVVVQVLWV
jgi:hypothetical protein